MIDYARTCNKMARENFVEVKATRVERCGKPAAFQTTGDGVVRGLCEFHGSATLRGAQEGWGLPLFPVRIEEVR